MHLHLIGSGQLVQNLLPPCFQPLCDTIILWCLGENIIRIQDIHYSLFWSMPTQPHKQNISIARLSGKELKSVCLGDFCLSLWWQVTRQYFVDRHLWSLNCWSFVSHNCCHGINVKNAENNFGITSKFTDRPTGAPTLTASSRSLQKITSVRIHLNVSNCKKIQPILALFINGKMWCGLDSGKYTFMFQSLIRLICGGVGACG